MFSEEISIEAINDIGKDSMSDFLGIEFIEVGKDYLIAKMPVNSRTKQPFGLLHGGASMVLSETLGSIASSLIANISNEVPVGLEINGNHLKSAKKGYVFGRVTPIHIGKSTHVWETRITSEANELICISRLTVAILQNKKK